MSIYSLASGSNNGQGLSWGDQAEAQRAASFVPQSSGGAPWWETVAAYGLGRWIDNKWPDPRQVQGNVQPDTFAGQNGMTYANVGGVAVQGQTMSLLLLVAGVGLVAYLATR